MCCLAGSSIADETSASVLILDPFFVCHVFCLPETLVILSNPLISEIS